MWPKLSTVAFWMTLIVSPRCLSIRDSAPWWTVTLNMAGSNSLSAAAMMEDDSDDVDCVNDDDDDVGNDDAVTELDQAFFITVINELSSALIVSPNLGPKKKVDPFPVNLRQ